MSFAGKVWKGELGLKKTFWAGFVAFAALSYSQSFLLRATISENPLPSAQCYALLAMSLVLGGLVALLVWRSSSLYDGRKVYKYVARLWVLLQIVGMATIAYAVHMIQQHPLN